MWGCRWPAQGPCLGIPKGVNNAVPKHVNITSVVSKPKHVRLGEPSVGTSASPAASLVLVHQPSTQPPSQQPKVPACRAQSPITSFTCPSPAVRFGAETPATAVRLTRRDYTEESPVRRVSQDKHGTQRNPQPGFRDQPHQPLDLQRGGSPKVTIWPISRPPNLPEEKATTKKKK